MKKNVKRVILLILAVLMLLGGMPLSVAAADYEYAMFPMTYMNITQGVNGITSHLNTNALDLAGKDDGIDNVFAPFTCVVKQKYTDLYGANVVWIQSVNPVRYADGSIDYMTILLVHDNNTSDLYVGQVISQGAVFFQEGTSGLAYGNHVHMEVGRGAFTGSGWHANPNPDMSWIINGSMVPWDALFISSSTVILNGYGYNWRYPHTHSFDKKTFMCACGGFDPASVKSTPVSKSFKIISDGAVDHTGPYGACANANTYVKGNVVTATEKIVNGYGHTWYKLDNGKYIYSDYLKEYSMDFADISSGDYCLLNLGTMKYLIVDEGKNTEGQNVSVWPKTGNAAEFNWALSKDNLGYVLTTKLGTRVLNPYVDGVVTPGSNITILSPGYNDLTQRWRLELVTGGYVIRSVTNLSCVLTVKDSHNVVADTFRAGDMTQIWQFETVSGCPHSWLSSVVTKNPSCNMEGIETFTCSMCGFTKNEVIAPTEEHVYDDGVVLTMGTCAKEGSVLYTCKDCEHSYVKNTGYGKNHGNLKCARSGEYLSVSKFTCETCKAEYTYDLGVKSITTTPVSKNEISVRIVFKDDRNIRKTSSLSFPATAVSDIHPNGVLGVIKGTLKSESLSGNIYTANITYTDDQLKQLVGDKHAVHIKFENKDDPSNKYGYVRVILEWKQGIYAFLKAGETADVRELLGTDLSGYTLCDYDTSVVSYKDGIVTAKKGGSTSLVFIHNMTGKTTGVTVVVEEEKPKTQKGDADGDGKVSAADARLALRASVGLESISSAQKKTADIDGNSKITSADARYILRYSVGLIDDIWK